MNLPALTEYQPQLWPSSVLSTAEGELLWSQYPNQLNVEFPSPRTRGQWELTSQGWAGYIPLSPERGLELRPKVAVANVFRMLEYAYGLDLNLLQGVMSCRTLEEFYQAIARVLALRILERGRKGFYRAYLGREEALSCVRGRLNVGRVARTPWAVQLHCRYQQYTGDIGDNRLLAWALWLIARSGLCDEPVLSTVRRAFHSLQHFVTLKPHSGQDCLNREYHRLNEDYRLLHALCRFFIDHTGPGLGSGDATMLPFLIQMSTLFEKFVAAWLKSHIGGGWKVEAQENFPFPGTGNVSFDIDLVFYDPAGRAHAVVDTKYKNPEKGRPSTADLAQIIAYAVTKNCREAVLLYPIPLRDPVDSIVQGIRIRSLTWNLNQNLHSAGEEFLRELAVESFAPSGTAGISRSVATS